MSGDPLMGLVGPRETRPTWFFRYQRASNASGRSRYQGANHAIVGNHIQALVLGKTRVSAGRESRNASTTPVEIRPAEA